MIRLFIADHYALMRSGLHLFLSQEPNLRVVGEAATGQALLDQLPTTPADVVLLDMDMPGGLNGVATARQLRLHFPAVRVLMLSVVEQPRQVGEALAAGAHGYLLKNASKVEIVAGIHTVFAGQRFLCSELGLALLHTVLGNAPPPLLPPLDVALSRRELEVLRLVTEGLTTQQIADKLFTSKRTVETQRQSLLEKTGTKNTAALVSYAHACQLLAMPPTTKLLR